MGGGVQGMVSTLCGVAFISHSSPSLPSLSYDKAIQEVADSEAKREVAEKELRLVSQSLKEFSLLKLGHFELPPLI